MRSAVAKETELASPRISIGGGGADSFFVVEGSVSCFIETNVSSVLLTPAVWRENVPGVSGVGMGIKDS